LSVVVDSSIALAWTLPDEINDRADAVLDLVIRDGGHVPFIFRAEFANGLMMAVRRGRFDRERRPAALIFLEGLELLHDGEGSTRLATVMELADEYALTVYDALYLDLAKRLGLPLATLDRKLTDAARRAAIVLAMPEASGPHR
jgi:predicted nucleic acid-binding protein